jgi:malate dehydrogenase (oxaloacetate-decarboxylating)(NADP+)
MIDVKAALNYHALGRPGKIEVVPTKPFVTQHDLSLAYTPGVAEPCRAIHKDVAKVFDYTAKGNLVAVVTNGTAVLGLGAIGPMAGKPVMEGKGNLFKRFADVDVFDIELQSEDPDEIVRVCELIAPTFGGINLEDIKAPECFKIERELQKRVDIPVFHDDQHGTAIISGAGLLNAVELVGKRIENVRIVIVGAGAAGIASAELYLRLGARKENLMLVDSKGVIHRDREEGMNPYKDAFAVDTRARTLADAMRGADVFLGLSQANIVSQEMVRSMADQPIIFALSNPDPEIPYEDARAARPDAVIATGRSDYPNQVNNVLGFPFIFRGSLDCRARLVNTEMKIAATHALASLAKEDVPDEVMRAYGGERIRFGRDYIIPKPFDHRVLLRVAPAVARAAMETGAARLELDLNEYVERLEGRLGRRRVLARGIAVRARRHRQRVVAFPEGSNDQIIRAAHVLSREGIARPCLIGKRDEIQQQMESLGVKFDGISIADDESPEYRETMAQELHQIRRRKGVTLPHARTLVDDPIVRAALMVRRGEADALIGGVAYHYPDIIRPSLQIIGTRDGVSVVAGLYVVIVKNQLFFFADTTVNIEPSAETLAEIALLTAEEVRKFDVVPRVAMLSFSNFGSARHPLSDKVRRATDIVKARRPDFQIDGEMQADTAVTQELLSSFYPFSDLKAPANVLIFPNLESGNIAYKLLKRIGGADVIGPILMGMRKPVHVVETGADVSTIVTMTAIAALESR